MIAATATPAPAVENLPALWKAEASELRKNAREARAHENGTADDFARADRLDMKADGKHECADELAASLARPASQPAATPAATPVRYFAYDGDNGDYNEYDTLAEAVSSAQESLDFAGDDGWPDGGPSVCYGAVLGEAREVPGSRRPSDNPDFDHLVDYELASAATTAPIDGWQTMESCPINTPVLLWSNDTSEKVIGYKPGDAPHPECVIVASSAAYADAWHPMPPDPEAEQEEPA